MLTKLSVLGFVVLQDSDITFTAVFCAQFFGPCSIFPLEFYFPISFHLASFMKV